MIAQIVFYGGGSVLFGGIGWLVSATLPDALPRKLKVAVAVLTSAAPIVILATVMAWAALNYGASPLDDPKLPILLAGVLPFVVPAALGTMLGLRSRSGPSAPNYPGVDRAKAR